MTKLEIEHSAIDAASSLLIDIDREYALKIVGAISDGDLTSAFDSLTEFWRLKISPQRRKGLRDLLDREILMRHELEVTTHGFKRTFRFWSEPEKERYLRFAVDVCRDIVECVSPHACIGYGAALAVARSNELIPHDDDVDIIYAVNVEECPTFMDGIAKMEREMGSRWLIAGDYATHRHIMDPVTGFSVDAFVGIVEGEFLTTYPGVRKSLHFETVFPPVKRDLYGVEVPFPCALKSYLSQIYGQTWETPDPSFSHNWDKKPFHPLL